MPFPTSVDPILDAPPVTANTVIHASQVLGPQRQLVGPMVYNPLSDVYGGKFDGVTDDTTAIQNAINDAGNAGGGRVILPAGRTAKTTQTLILNKGNVELAAAGPGATINFIGTAPFTAGVNDRAIQIIGSISNRRQIAAGAIAVGATSFTAQNASDTSDLVAGDWLIIAEYDSLAGPSGEVVITDWVQVRSVVSTVVNIQGAFRTAFPNARTFGTSPLSGLGFVRITTLVDNCKIRDLTVLQPTASQSNPSISVQLARGATLANCFVDNAFGQAYNSYRCSDLTLIGCRAKNSGTNGSEFAATVDLVIQGCSFGTDGDANTSQAQPSGSSLQVDFGTAFFSIIGNRFRNAGNINVQILMGCHDGEFSENVLGWTRNAGIAGQGISMTGCQRVVIAKNVLAGGEGASTGVTLQNSTTLNVNINTNENVIAFNTVRNFATLYNNPVVGSTDVLIIGGSSGTGSALDIVADTTVRDALRLQDVSGARVIKVGPGSGAGGQFGIFDNTAAALLLSLIYATGQLKVKDGVSPGTDASAMQTGRIFMGSGVPNNANGANGDFYFRTDTPGTANQRLYIRSAGAWVALTL